MRTVFRVFSYLKRYPLLAGSQLTCAVLMTLLVIVFPGVTKAITAEVIPQRDFDRLLPLALLALGTFFATNLFNALRIILNNTFEQKVIFDIRSDLYRKIQRLPMQWFDNKRTGDIMTRVTEDVTAMERVLIDGIEQGVVALLQVFVVGGYLFYLDAHLALITMIPMPFLVIGAWAYTHTSPARHRRVRKATSSMNSLLHDNVDGIQQIKIFTREEEELGRFNRSSNKLREATLHLMRVWAAYNPSMEFCRNAGYVLVIGFGAWSVMNSPDQQALEAQTGVFVAFLVALSLFYEPISRLNGLNQIIQAGRAAGERVFEIIDAEEETGLDDGEILSKPVRGEVILKDVEFSYGDNIPTLQGVSMEAKPGQMIALVGHTGAGKSTIINLLTRFYETSAGEISIDGKSIHSLKKSSLRDATGYVTQESFLFNGSVRENLIIAREDATETEMWDALRAANASAFVEALPKQLDTNVGERGVKLSVGEKQRISIARVILKNPPILLLDEATASVDTETEKLIQEALEKLMSNRTSFVIAHRLSTVRNADRIYVLEQGRIVEEGDHETLLARNGTYSMLCRQSLMAMEKVSQ
ncbi:MAG: ABC transporter ATP-binding protein [Verrucomicrobiales bacterium]|jgi:ATP-binding cassette subfamily B protein|nr:ABC transporter ATP-binding protein [Verrucomicrobiales bacterium]MBP9222685.1 ABC transporter ATP-binding protein [Verrucomicrobiales bacterium]HQZ27850.1 ABC transporter ATP-binding protein [Verrucomicrobiales bacterium]